MNLRVLEKATESKFTTVRAYSAVHDDVENAAKFKAKFPKSNFADVVPAQLKKDNFQTLVMQAGSVDITNMNTKDDPTKHIEYFKKETVSAAKHFFKTGENALSANPKLEKVVMMNKTPRYDPANVDPLCLKPALAELYNNTMTEQWMSSGQKDKIVIGNHNIDCVGAIRQSRYMVTKTGKYDGIHLFGSSGQKSFTNSVLNILKFSQLTSPKYDFHQNCPQTKRQQQTYKQRQQTDHQWQQVQGNRRTNNSRDEGFRVPMENRFETLSDLNQGNY